MILVFIIKFGRFLDSVNVLPIYSPIIPMKMRFIDNTKAEIDFNITDNKNNDIPMQNIARIGKYVDDVIPFNARLIEDLILYFG